MINYSYFDWKVDQIIDEEMKGESLYLKDKNKRICFRVSSDMAEALEIAYLRETNGTISKSDYIRKIVRAYVKKYEHIKTV